MKGFSLVKQAHPVVCGECDMLKMFCKHRMQG